MRDIFLSGLSKAINAYLALDPETKPRLKKLAGKMVAIELLPLHFKFELHITETGIDIQHTSPKEADTHIRGTPLQLLGMMIAKENRHHFFADDVVIEGNAELGQQIIALFDELEIDWEAYLAAIIGDVPAFQTGRVVRGVKKWLAKAEKSFSDNIHEYVHEEAQWLPGKEALSDFFNDIDTLTMDVDRAGARIQRIIDMQGEK